LCVDVAALAVDLQPVAGRIGPGDAHLGGQPDTVTALWPTPP
jgi:hypothetical protein